MVSRDHEGQHAAADPRPAAPGGDAPRPGAPGGTVPARDLSRGGIFDEAARTDDEVRDWDWAVLPAGSVRTRCAAPSGSLAVAAMGKPQNPRVVLVPGATGSKEDFAVMMPELAEAGFFVLSYDIAGQYESAGAGPENLVPPRRHYDYELFVNDFIAVLESGEGPAHVVGYSFAAILAQIAFSQRPELFRSLTLLSCPPEPGQSFRGVSRIGPFSFWANGRVGAAIIIWGLRRNLNHVSPKRLQFVRNRFRYTRRQSIRDIFELMKRVPDLRQTLADAALPKFVAVGEHDVWPLQLHRRFAQSIGARISVYRGGHSPSETSPHQFVRDLIALYTKPG